MTREEREEAINIISQMIKDEEGFLSNNTVKAHKMAIKALEQDPKYIETIDFAIDASDGDTNYCVGFRNGLRYAKSLIDGEESQFESCVDQKPCEDANYNSINSELNGDMISRQAVNEIINDIRDCISVEGYWAFLERLKKLPPVNPTKTGHWIDDGFYAEGHSHKAFHCSGCGYNVLGFKEDLSNYCPNCGVKMVEKQERSNK